MQKVLAESELQTLVGRATDHGAAAGPPAGPMDKLHITVFTPGPGELLQPVTLP
jgi:hypothetical protein